MSLPEKTLYDEIKDILISSQLPPHDFVFELADACSSVLENEIADYRPADSSEHPGGLLDFRGFSENSSSNLPDIVLPDLHARPFFLLHILDFVIPGSSLTVFQALEQGLIHVICVGDALHSEFSTKKRWHAVSKEFEDEIYTGPAMTEEMTDGLNLVCGLMRLKIAFPENFHFLKGNHENILNKSEGGDYSFYKYADEGYMCHKFIQEYYGDDIIHLISCVENGLPLIAVTDTAVISHAEPMYAFSRQELIDARLDDGLIIESLTWTQNNTAQSGSVEETIKNLANKDVNCYTYLAGHRPVVGKFKSWYSGLFVQIHNPALQNVALVYRNRKFNPENDIINVLIK